MVPVECQPKRHFAIIYAVRGTAEHVALSCRIVSKRIYRELQVIIGKAGNA
jgi:hypothetical protein